MRLFFISLFFVLFFYSPFSLAQRDVSHVLPNAVSIDVLDAKTAKKKTTFITEVANSPQEQERGLMFREYMQKLNGMLFDFKHDQPLAFWMKNTYIPLDMLFVGENNEIVHVHADAVPFSEETIPSLHPARYVVEINGGLAKEYGIVAGDKILIRK